MSCVIIIPTYNEAANIKKIITELLIAAPDATLVVADDSSPDGTANVVRQLEKNNPNLHLYSRPAKTGLGAAYQDAILYVLKNFSPATIITMDADGSHSPAAIPTLRAALEKYDLVIGSRYVAGGQIEHWNFWRRLLSRAGNWYARLTSGIPIQDMTAGFVGFQTHLIPKINLNNFSALGYFYQIEFKFWCVNRGATWREIPITFLERTQGVSKINWRIIKEAFFHCSKLIGARWKNHLSSH